MSRQMSPAASRRSAASPAVSRRSSVASFAGTGRIGVPRDGIRSSQSAPSLRKQLDGMGDTGFSHSKVLGTMATTMGAKLSSTLHHRGEHDVGAIIDPNDEHVYVPRAMWTQSHDHPLKANNAQWNKQHFVADELKRLHGEAKKKEYIQRTIDGQLQENDDRRNRMINEKKEYADLVNADARRHMQDQERLRGEQNKGRDMMLSGLADQNADLARRAHEARVREAQEAAETKMRTVQQMCEEMAEQGRKKKQMMHDLQQGMQNSEKMRIQSRVDKANDDERCRREIREALMQDEYRKEATNARIAAKQDQQDACVALYERTAGAANRARDQAEVTRIDNDEKKHLMRTDAYFAQRERARERQRQNMVNDLNKQMAACDQKRRNDQLSKQAEREAIQAATKRSMDQEMAKAMNKKAEEQQLQQELRVMMLEKEERQAKEGYTKSTALSTMNTVMRRNGNACNAISNLNQSMEAARFTAKPLGREEPSRVVPLDASPSTIRKLTKERSPSYPFKGEMPHSSVLGGVVGTLGGGGGSYIAAMMATGGPFLPKTVGIAIQDRKLDSAWHEGLRPELIAKGRREARRREAAKAEANRD